MKIYIVIGVDYFYDTTDITIRGAFETREEAEAIKNKYKYLCDIVEVEIGQETEVKVY